MVQKQKNAVFMRGNLWTVAVSTDFMSARMCEMISHNLSYLNPMAIDPVECFGRLQQIHPHPLF